MIDHTDIRSPRRPQSRIRVTYQNGDSICYHHAKDTLMDVLRRIECTRLPEIKFESKGERIITDCVSKQNEKYALPICEGWWYIKKGTDTKQMVLQLIEINRVLNLGIKVEYGPDLMVTGKVEKESKSVRRKKKVRVRFSDGTILEDDTFIVVYRDFIELVGVERIGSVDAKNEITWLREPLITTTNVNNNRARLGEFKWFLEPRTTSEARKMIALIASKCYIDCRIEIY